MCAILYNRIVLDNAEGKRLKDDHEGQEKEYSFNRSSVTSELEIVAPKVNEDHLEHQ